MKSSHRIEVLHPKNVQKLGNKILLACSGGPDSMAALDFFRRGKKDITVIYVNHGTEHGHLAEDFVRHYCKQHDLHLHVAIVNNSLMEEGESKEAFWHRQRYNYFDLFTGMYEAPVVTCHHLDDQVENWIMTCATGNPVLIPPYNERYKVYRPFVLNKKQVLIDWCIRHRVPFVRDPSNDETKYTRNYVRHKIVPEMLVINPGLYKVIKKKILGTYGK